MAIAPTEEKRKPRFTPPPVVDTPRTDGVRCQYCGTYNDPSWHFCHGCSRKLAEAIAPRVPWYRRLFRGRRPPAAGERHAPVRTMTVGSVLRTFIVTLLVVLLAGGLLAYAAVPTFRQAANSRVDTLVTQVRRQFGTGIVEVHPVGARASSELSGHPARFAADLIDNDYWAADTARDHQPTLVIQFDGPTDLDYLLVMNGAGGPDYAKLARPKSVQIVYSDGTGERLTLKDDPKPTQYTVHARGITSLSIRVDSVYAAGSTQAALTEIEFYHLK